MVGRVWECGVPCISAAVLLHIKFKLSPSLQVVSVYMIPNWFNGSTDAVNPADPTAVDDPMYTRGMTINISLFSGWILGNIIETFQILSMKYKSDALRYVSFGEEFLPTNDSCYPFWNLQLYSIQGS